MRGATDTDFGFQICPGDSDSEFKFVYKSSFSFIFILISLVLYLVNQKANLGASLVTHWKEFTCNARDLGLIPGQEDPPEKGVDTQSNILAWRIPWTEGPGGL